MSGLLGAAIQTVYALLVGWGDDLGYLHAAIYAGAPWARSDYWSSSSKMALNLLSYVAMQQYIPHRTYPLIVCRIRVK